MVGNESQHYGLEMSVIRQFWSLDLESLHFGLALCRGLPLPQNRTNISNSTECDVTALRATLTTHQEALDQRELGLQERIEGMDERIREVRRAVGYHEEAVGRHEEVVERRYERGKRGLRN